MTEHEMNGLATSGEGLPNDPNNVPENWNGCERIENDTPPAPVAASAVTWIGAAMDALRGYEADYGEPLPDDYELGCIEDSRASPSFRIRVGHIRRLAATPLSPIPIADNPAGETVVNALDPDMPAQEMRLHMGELSAQEMRAARAAIRWANSRRVLACLEPGQGELSPDRVKAAVKFAQSISLSDGYFWPDYMRDLWRVMNGQQVPPPPATEGSR